MRPGKAAERAIALGDDDPFLYALALELGWSHSEVLARLTVDEVERFRAFYTWRAVQRQHAADVGAARARR